MTGEENLAYLIDCKSLPTAGKLCAECGNHTMIRKDGCDFCTACGAVGSCG